MTAEQGTTLVALVQDGIAHRPHKTDGERVQVACRTEGSLPLELFKIELVHHCRPELRCALCFLTPVVVVCQQHLSWMPKGQACPDCTAQGMATPTWQGSIAAPVAGIPDDEQILDDVHSSVMGGGWQREVTTRTPAGDEKSYSFRDGALISLRVDRAIQIMTDGFMSQEAAFKVLGL